MPSGVRLTLMGGASRTNNDATPTRHIGTSVELRNTTATTAKQTMKPIIAAPTIAALIYRAYSRKSLTPVGILTAFATAIVHAIHPWSVFFALLAVFFLAGTTVTKVCIAD